MTYRHLQDGILVRPLAMEDAASLHRAVTGSIGSLSRWLPWCRDGYSLADAHRWIGQGLASWEAGSAFPLGVFDSNGRVIGGTGVNQIDAMRTVGNLGYWVCEAVRGRGVATAAARAAARMGFEFVGLMRLEIAVLPDNLASRRVAEKLGAVREAEARHRRVRQGRPATAVVYSLLPGDVADRRNTMAKAR